jgi:predicted dehydrogenase
MSSRWHADREISGGGVLVDNGTHSVDLIRYFLGPIAEVHAVEGRRVQQLAVEDTVRLFVRSAGGVMGSIDLSWSMNKELDSFIDIYGSLGTVRVGWRESKYRQVSSPDWVTFGKGYDKVDALRSLIDNFAGAARGEEPCLISSRDGLASVEVIEAAYDSLRRERWTAVNDRSTAARESAPAARAAT